MSDPEALRGYPFVDWHKMREAFPDGPWAEDFEDVVKQREAAAPAADAEARDAMREHVDRCLGTRAEMLERLILAHGIPGLMLCETRDDATGTVKWTLAPSEAQDADSLWSDIEPTLKMRLRGIDTRLEALEAERLRAVEAYVGSTYKDLSAPSPSAEEPAAYRQVVIDDCIRLRGKEQGRDVVVRIGPDSTGDALLVCIEPPGMTGDDDDFTDLVLETAETAKWSSEPTLHFTKDADGKAMIDDIPEWPEKNIYGVMFSTGEFTKRDRYRFQKACWKGLGEGGEFMYDPGLALEWRGAPLSEASPETRADIRFWMETMLGRDDDGAEEPGDPRDEADGPPRTWREDDLMRERDFLRRTLAEMCYLAVQRNLLSRDARIWWEEQGQRWLEGCPLAEERCGVPCTFDADIPCSREPGHGGPHGNVGKVWGDPPEGSILGATVHTDDIPEWPRPAPPEPARDEPGLPAFTVISGTADIKFDGEDLHRTIYPGMRVSKEIPEKGDGLIDTPESVEPARDEQLVRVGWSYGGRGGATAHTLPEALEEARSLIANGAQVTLTKVQEDWSDDAPETYDPEKTAMEQDEPAREQADEPEPYLGRPDGPFVVLELGSEALLGLTPTEADSLAADITNRSKPLAARLRALEDARQEQLLNPRALRSLAARVEALEEKANANRDAVRKAIDDIFDRFRTMAGEDILTRVEALEKRCEQGHQRINSLEQATGSTTAFLKGVPIPMHTGGVTVKERLDLLEKQAEGREARVSLVFGALKARVDAIEASRIAARLSALEERERTREAFGKIECHPDPYEALAARVEALEGRLSFRPDWGLEVEQRLARMEGALERRQGGGA